MPFKNIYTLEDYDKAIELHRQGFGSLRISKILGYKIRGAVEDWINKDRKPYYFSERRIQACNSEENIERMRAMNKITQPKAVKISAELRTKKLPENAKYLSEDLAYILGVVYGDGHVSIKQRRTILGVTDKDFAIKFKETIEKWSGFKARFFTIQQKPEKYVKKRKIKYVSYIDSIEASKFLKHFNLNFIKNSENKVKCAFIRGFFDSEGTVFNIDKRHRLGLACFNTKYYLILLVRLILDSLSIESKIYKRKNPSHWASQKYKPYYVLSITKKESILKFYSLIGFNIERKQERLERQIDYIRSKSEVTKMTDKEPDRNTVFVGDRPFMKSN